MDNNFPDIEIGESIGGNVHINSIAQRRRVRLDRQVETGQQGPEPPRPGAVLCRGGLGRG